MGSYSEMPPPQGLAPSIACFWTATLEKSSQSLQPILPDGCVDLVFKVSQSNTIQGWVVGAMTQARLPADSGIQTYYGLRFRPGGATCLLRSSIHEFTNGSFRLNDIVPGLESEILRRFDCLGLETFCLQDVAAGVTEYCHGRLVRPDRRLAYACTRIDQGGGQLPLAEIAREMGMTRQHLGRIFRSQVGLSPKLYARIRRFQNVIAMAQTLLPRWGWAGVAHQFGYVDQSHLIADFQALSRTTPAKFFSSLS